MPGLRPSFFSMEHFSMEMSGLRPLRKFKGSIPEENVLIMQFIFKFYVLF